MKLRTAALTLLTLPALLWADTEEAPPVVSTGPTVEVDESDAEIALPTPQPKAEAPASGKEKEEPREQVTAETPLSTEELSAAIKSDAISIPTPGELMAALGKEAQPNWQSRYRPPIPTTFSSRAQIALNLGGLIADGYIALEAKDGQQIKNIGKDIIALARNLAVGENVIARGNSIIDFADNSQWTALQEELEATQNEVKLALREQRDADLITLVTTGGWIRGTAILSSFIDENYTTEAAELLRQPGIAAYLREKLSALPERTRNEKLVKRVDQTLAEMEELVARPPDLILSDSGVKRLKEISESIVSDISSKEDK